MKLKRFITLLLLSVYLFMVAGQVFGALACSCVEFHTEQTNHSCCSACSDHGADTHSIDLSEASFKGICCSDDHSTDVDLYTSLDDSSKQLRRLLLVDDTITIVIYLFKDDGNEPLSDGVELSERRILLSDDPSLVGISFRAPPVLA